MIINLITKVLQNIMLRNVINSFNENYEKYYVLSLHICILRKNLKFKLYGFIYFLYIPTMCKIRFSYKFSLYLGGKLV